MDPKKIIRTIIIRIQQPNNVKGVRVTLIGLFPLHKGKNCDQIVEVKNYNGFQRMEAFVLALKELNNRTEVKDSNILLEAILYDTCSDVLAEHVSFYHKKLKAMLKLMFSL